MATARTIMAGHPSFSRSIVDLTCERRLYSPSIRETIVAGDEISEDVTGSFKRNHSL